MCKIIPAILTDSEKIYQKQLLQAQHVSDLIQIDIIDGDFTNNKTIDIETLSKYHTDSNLEIQLMVNHPIKYINELANLTFISRIIFPFEIRDDISECIYLIKNTHKQVGISINPKTSVSSVVHLLDKVDLLLLLAVNPGFSGQEFQKLTYEKITEAKSSGPIAIEVDGGVNEHNIQNIAKSGVDFIAVNSALFASEDFYIAYDKLAKLTANK